MSLRKHVLPFMLTLLLSLALRLALLGMGVFALTTVVQSTMNSFDVFAISSSTVSPPPKWVQFLGGEFTLSCLFPFGYHLIRASVHGGRSLSNVLALGILMGVSLGQIIAKHHFVEGATLVLAFVVVILYVLVDQRGRVIAVVSSEEETQTLFASRIVTVLIKLGSVLLIVTGIMVLGMGVTTRQPVDILPQLVWEGFGYEYNVTKAFGQSTVESPEFFGALLCTMLGTICQTLCVGIWIWCSPVGSPACREGLWYSCSGVPLIILANSITAALYQQNSFDAGRDCMIAHILLLLQTNAHLPLLWWVHEVWVEMVVLRPAEKDDTAGGQKAKIS